MLLSSAESAVLAKFYIYQLYLHNALIYFAYDTIFSSIASENGASCIEYSCNTCGYKVF
ncbi:hypothetical protein APHCRT_0702 [Anaplasma phagocytophilum str. CRT53-1]|uniref:Uncharacterized protein n=1 Tax=Anaplasma phagocytophilum str. CRT53-1 TaxID=1359157 RepID=A0A0F3Q1Z9_ANAPH|nr:hypothetical protein APHCRT_0702 [Anaplasma phagocytophilum str. CRT53-1]